MSESDASVLLEKAMDVTRGDAQAGFIGQWQKDNKAIDPVTVARDALLEFDRVWSSDGGKESLVPPKDVLSHFSGQSQARGHRGVSARALSANMLRHEVDAEMRDLLLEIEPLLY